MPLGDAPWDKSPLLGYQLKISPIGVPAPYLESPPPFRLRQKTATGQNAGIVMKIRGGSGRESDRGHFSGTFFRPLLWRRGSPPEGCRWGGSALILFAIPWSKNSPLGPTRRSRMLQQCGLQPSSEHKRLEHNSKHRHDVCCHHFIDALFLGSG